MFSLNHMSAPRKGVAEFFGLARSLGISAVEIRNDLSGVALHDGTPHAITAAAAKAAGLRVLSINGLQRFNDWTKAREQEAIALADACVATGAEALVLVPVNHADFKPTESKRLKGLRAALAGLAPILEQRGLMGFVEPLGFEECSLRRKSEAVAAIDELGLGARFRLVHDTFHHVLAGEAAIFPERTGLVHVSGVDDRSKPINRLRDAERVLITKADRLDNIGQIKALRAGGYKGFYSFEPFAESVHGAADIAADLRASMAVLAPALA